MRLGKEGNRRELDFDVEDVRLEAAFGEHDAFSKKEVYHEVCPLPRLGRGPVRRFRL